MKLASAIALWICLHGSASGSTDSLNQRIGLLGEIPLLIETAYSIYTWHNESVIELGPGRLRILEPPRGRSFEFDHLLRKKGILPFPAKRMQAIEIVYRIGNRNWLPVRRSPKDSTEAILDVQLNRKDVLWIAWREAGKNDIQPYLTFQVVEKAPEITGYRLNRVFDTSRKSKTVDNTVLHYTQDQIGYHTLTGTELSIPAGTIPEFRIKSYTLLTGKPVSYRLTENKSKIESAWQNTGHVLAIPGLSGDKTYQLELRFPGQEAISIYTLIVAAYWYEKLWVRVIALILLMVLTFLVTRWVYKRRLLAEQDRRNRVEEQLKTLQSRLNPHFIFNALNSIEGLVSSGQNLEANHYLSLFSDILRQTLAHSDELLISLHEDVDLLDTYLRIEQLRFGFAYEIKISPEVQISTIEVPPMLLQPLVENAVKHGVSGKAEKGLIVVTIGADKDDLIIAVIDNGNGLPESQKIVTAGGHGLKFTRERLAQFAKLHPAQPIEFSIIHSHAGTTAQMVYRNFLA